MNSVRGFQMSGGLLEKAKAVEKKDEVAEAVEAVIETPAAASASSGSELSSKAKMWLGGFAVITLFNIYGLLTLNTLFGGTPVGDYAGILVLLTLGLGFYVGMMAWREARLAGGPMTTGNWVVYGMAFMLLSVGPYVAGMDMGGSVAISEVAYADDGSTIDVTFYHSAGLMGTAFSGDSVDVTITQGAAVVYEGAVSVTLTETASGTKGSMTMNIADFYDGNANAVTGKNWVTLTADDGYWIPVTTATKYTLSISVGGASEGTTALDEYQLTRTINDVDGEATPIHSQDADGGECDGGKEACVRGIALTAGVGISNSGVDADTSPARSMGWYTLDATFAYKDGGEDMIVYPTVTVTKTTAEWDADGGAYGSGGGIIGEHGSSMLLEGSTTDGDSANRLHFPREDVFSDYGCYTLTMSVTNDATWGGGTVTETTHYEWAEVVAEDDNGQYESESFEQVNSC